MSETFGEDEAVIERARTSGKVLLVAIGVSIFGLSIYGYLSLAGQSLGPELFAPLSVLWSLLNAIGIGLFLPFEQELGRQTAARRSRGEGNRPVVRQALFAAVGALAVVALIAAVGARQLGSQLFADNVMLVPLLVLAMASMALSYVVRGLLSGNGRFGNYGAQLAVDGALRVGGALALHASGTTSLAAYAGILVVAPVVAAVITWPRRTHLVTPGPGQDARVAANAISALVGASLLSQLLANAGPLIVQVLATAAEHVVSGQFLAALVIARIPLFLFTAVQAVLLPGLAELVSRGDVAGFGRRVGLVGAVTAAIGLSGTIAIWALGTRLVPLLFGREFGIDRGVITLMAASGAAFMLAQVVAQALLALCGERRVLVGWALGVVALVAACLWNGPIADRAAWALVAGAVAAFAALLELLRREHGRWRLARGV